ncbi:hypothetical protein DFH06DRAFT_1462758 [Mycena polygramma]|nr:hypothetical protein DFH06DRAFT_1462758 [Mycena polygramma]
MNEISMLNIEVPYELVDLILSQAIGQVIYENVEKAFQSQSLQHSLFLTWDFLGTLAGVSTVFRAIVLKLVALVFQIQLPCESQSIFPEAYAKFRSLLLFKGASMGGAVMDPPLLRHWQAPLMQAYGYYYTATSLVQGLLLRRRRADVYLALAFCQDTVAGISQPLLDRLQHVHRELEIPPGISEEDWILTTDWNRNFRLLLAGNP